MITAPAVPRWLWRLALAIVVAMPVVILVGGWRTGVAWDETYHVFRMRTFLEHGWYLLDGDLTTGNTPRPGDWVRDTYVYGPVTMALLHGLCLLVGIDHSGQVAATATAYAVRHLGVAVIGMLGVGATAALVRIVLGSWRWAVVGAAALLATPLWSGQSMFNIKDVPVATGYTLTTLGLALLSRPPSGRFAHRVGVVCVLVVGIVLAVGTRPGIWVGLVGGILVWATAMVLTRQRLLGRLVGQLVELGLGVAVAGVVLLAVYPRAFSHPVTALVEAATASSDYGNRAGVWWYLPGHLFTGMPTLLLLAVCLGTTIAATRLLPLFRGRNRTVDPTTIALAVIGAQAFGLPLIAVLKQSNLYNGLRQMLFATPAVIVLATVAIAAVVGWAQRREGLPRRVASCVLAVALVAPAVGQLRLWPYDYAWTTWVGDHFAPFHEEDYWRTSVRALAAHVPAGGFVVCSPVSDGAGHTLARGSESNEDCASDEVGPLAAYAHLRRPATALPATAFYAVITQSQQPGSNCRVVDRVTRPSRWWFTPETMSLVARCDLVLPRWSGSTDFGADGAFREISLGGLTAHHGEPGVRLPDGVARLGLGIASTNRPLPLEVVATGRPGLRANGVALPLTAVGRDTWRTTVPTEALARAGENRLLLDLRLSPTDRLLRLSTTGGPR